MAGGDQSFNYKDYNSFIHLLQTRSSQHHDRVFIRYQASSDDDLEFKTLTYGQFDHVTTYLAHRWSTQLDGVQCVGLLSDDPILSLLAMVAVLKHRRIFFPISTTNSVAAVTELLTKTNTQYLIASEQYRQLAQASANPISNIRLKIWELGDVDQLISLASGYTGHAQYSDLQSTAALDDIVLVLQSSGSTGLPKPFYLSNRFFILALRYFTKKEKASSDEPFLESTDTMLSTSSFFHGTGVMVYLSSMTVGAQSVIFRSPPPSAEALLSVIVEKNITMMSASPVHLINLAKHLQSQGSNEVISSALNRIKLCCYGGAPLSMNVGNYLRAQGLNIRCGYGGTEINIFALANFSKDNEYWYTVKPIEIASRYCHWEPVDHNTYHLMVRGDCPTLCPAIAANAGPEGYYATNDLFQEEPPNSGYWRHVNRIDDTIILSDGGKTNPISLENEIRNANIVKHCVVVGHHRKRIGVLIELNKEQADIHHQSQIASEVHEAVREANKNAAQAHSVIAIPEMIYILPPGRTLPITSKDTVARKKAIQEFEKDINTLYDNFL